MKKRILLVDDEKDLRRVIKDFLVKEDYEVYEAENGEIALDQMAEVSQIQCVVLDVMMPVMDGWSTLKTLKKSYPEIPVIMLTARNQIDDEVFGFELGADDYVAKPFVAARLIARIKAVLKKHHLDEEDLFTAENLVYNMAACKLSVDSKEVTLTPKEHELMQYFIINKNIALSREKLLDQIWGYDYYGDIRTVDTHIKRLRVKLGDNADLIKTVRGVGYRFEVAYD